jgi:hypothetical protein
LNRILHGIKNNMMYGHGTSIASIKQALKSSPPCTACLKGGMSAIPIPSSTHEHPPDEPALSTVAYDPKGPFPVMSKQGNYYAHIFRSQLPGPTLYMIEYSKLKNEHAFQSALTSVISKWADPYQLNIRVMQTDDDSIWKSKTLVQWLHVVKAFSCNIPPLTSIKRRREWSQFDP